MPARAPTQLRAGIWANRDFRLIWSGQALSELGTGLSQLSYPLLMLAITGSPAQAGALAAVRALPYVIFGLHAGALADRCDRRRLMLGCEIARAVLIASIPIAALVAQVSAAQLYVTGFLGGVGYVLFSAAETGALPNLVTEQELTPAISAQEAASSAASVAAPPLGGALYSIAPTLPFLVDAISYLASAAALARVRTSLQVSGTARPTDGLRRRDELLAGARWMWRHRGVRTVGLAAAALQLAISAVGLTVVVGARRDGAGSATIGLVLAAVGVGGVLGAVLAPRVQRRFGLRGSCLVVIWVQAGLWVLFAVSPGLAVTGVALGAFALTMPVFGIAALSYQLAATPDGLRGRVGTAFGMLTWGATPIGVGIAGLLLQHATPATVSWCFAGWVVLVGLGCRRLGALVQP